MPMNALVSPANVLPPAPATPEATGLSFAFLVELAAKALLVRGRLRLPELVAHLHLLPGVLNPLLTFMREQRLCETTRWGDTESGIEYALSELGRARADEFMRRSQYAGPAPVDLADYAKMVERQSVAGMGVTRERLQAAFADMALPETLLEQFGAAMNSGRTLFVYGPPGSGKTYLAERLVRLLSGHIAVPHALAVNGEVIRIFDPLVHVPAEAPPPAGVFDRGAPDDARWVRCRRPVVMTGAELTLDAVDLDFDRETRFYHAPPQLKANNGLFILDDLGRQRVSAQALMDRWIVPLDRRIDYLGLHTGQKFCVPFDVLVVFSSNLHPAELADDAFLRRLGYKIHVGALAPEQYRHILRQECARLALPYADEGFDYLRERYRREGRALLACQPRDLLGQVCDLARFHGHAPEMSPALLGWAWDNYFVREPAPAPGVGTSSLKGEGHAQA